MATGLAQKLRQKAPLMMETYVAYGATRELVKECVKPGDYKIPQAIEKGGVIPTDENGVHLGQAEGWWYDSKFFTDCLQRHGSQCSSTRLKAYIL